MTSTETIMSTVHQCSARAVTLASATQVGGRDADAASVGGNPWHCGGGDRQHRLQPGPWSSLPGLEPRTVLGRALVLTRTRTKPYQAPGMTTIRPWTFPDPPVVFEATQQRPERDLEQAMSTSDLLADLEGPGKDLKWQSSGRRGVRPCWPAGICGHVASQCGRMSPSDLASRPEQEVANSSSLRPDSLMGPVSKVR